jgi:nicotinamidase-related amidase
LQENNIKNVFVVGLAYDFCVAHTAYDSIKSGFDTFIIKEACRGISDPTTIDAENNFIQQGIKVISSEDMENLL